MSEAFRVCDLEMAPYYETAREFCDIDGGTAPGGGGGGGTSGDGATNELAPGELQFYLKDYLLVFGLYYLY